MRQNQKKELILKKLLQNLLLKEQGGERNIMDGIGMP